jgi:regulator of replication initiation timing
LNNLSSSSAATSSPSKVTHTYENKDPINIVTIKEKVNLTKKQNEVLQMICNSYQMSISEYMQEALVEAMRFDIEEGNFSDILLEKIDEGKKKENSKSIRPGSVKDELDKLHKQQFSVVHNTSH